MPSPLLPVKAPTPAPANPFLLSFLKPGAKTLPAPATVGKTAAKTAPSTTPQQSNHELYLDTVTKVRGGQLTTTQGAQRLKAAGFPDSDNPFTNEDAPGLGTIVHKLLGHVPAIAAERQSNNQAKEYAAAHPDNPFQPIGAGTREGGTITPGTGIFAGLLGSIANESTYDPSGTYDAIEHPLRTAQQIGKQVVQTAEHPEHHIANALLLGSAAAAGGGSLLSRFLGAGKAVGEGAGVGAALTRPTAEGGSLLHAPPATPREFTLGQPTNESIETHAQGLRDATTKEAAAYHAAELDKALAANAVGETGLQTARLLPSRNPAFNVLQQLHDRVLRGALEKNPEGLIANYATKRLGGYMTSARRVTEAVNDVPAQMLRVAGKNLNPAEKRALDLTSNNTTPEARIATHEQRITEIPTELQANIDKVNASSAPDRQKAAQIRGLENDAKDEQQRQIAELGLLHQIKESKLTHVVHDDQGEPHVFINPDVAPHLAQADARLATAQAANKKIVLDTGQMSEEGEQARVDAPGRVVAGARYTKPTPGRLGVSPALDRAQAQVDRLQKAWDSLEAKGKKGGYVVTERPRTLEEAQGRLQELEQRNEGLKQGVKAKLFADKQTPEDKAEQLRRNQSNSKYDRQQARVTRSGRRSGASSSKVSRRMPTVKSEQDRMVDDEIQRLIDQHAGEPWADAIRKDLDEHTALHTALHPDIFEEPNPGTVSDAEFRHSAPSIDRTGGALSVAKDQLEQQQRRVHGYTIPERTITRGPDKGRVVPEEFVPGTVEPTGLIGGDDAPPGRGFVPARPTAPATIPGSVGRALRRVVGKARAPMTKEPYTGESLLTAKIPADPAKEVADNLTRQLKFYNDDTARRHMASLGHDTRQTDRDDLVNTQELKNAKVPEPVQVAFEQRRSTLTEPEHVATLAKFRARILPKPEDLEPEQRAAFDEGQHVPGYKYVDANLLGSLKNEPVSIPRRLKVVAKVNDAIVNAEKNAIVYLKPAHFAQRAGTNAFFNLVQGSANPRNLAIAARWAAQMPDDLVQEGMAVGGQGYAQSLAGADVGIGSKIAHAGAKFYAHATDAPSRWSSVVYEARKAGFNTPEKFGALIRDPQYKADLEQIGIRANREVGDYARLGPVEQNVIRRVIFFYPWIKTSTMFAGHMLLEHPITSAALAEVGQAGQTNADKGLHGEELSYEPGAFKAGGGLVTPRAIDPFDSPASLVNAGLALAGGKSTDSADQLSSLLGPVAKTALDATFHLGPYGDRAPSSESGLDIAKGDLISGTPEAQIESLLTGKKNPDQSTKLFPTTLDTEAEKLGIGSWWPKPFNEKVFDKDAETEKKAGLQPAARIAYTYQNGAQTLLNLAKAHWAGILQDGQLPVPWRQAIAQHRARALQIEKLGLKKGSTTYQRQAYQSDISMIAAAGKITAAQRREAMEWSNKADASRLAEQRAAIGRHFFGGAVLAYVKKALKERGADTSGLPW